MKPFENVTVLDFTQFTSGPVCTSIMGDLGAEVIKIENPPYGDNNRYNPPSVNKKTCYISSLDHNKKSVLLNLKDERQKEIFFKMVKTADVVVDNFKAGTMEKFGCGYEKLKEINPRIVCTSISGFGQTGPWRTRAAYDVIVQAVAGLMSVTGETGGRPLRFGVSMADVTSGLMACVATLAALCDAKRTGVGRYIDLGMMDNVLYHYVLEAEGYKTLVDALAEVDIKPEDVTRICLSHLHSDHAWNLQLFRKDIPIYVQRKEVEHAVSPWKIERNSYQRIDRPGCPGWMRGIDQSVLKDGDYEIEPGLKALFTPGHTCGSQSFLIDTKDGQYIYVGDLYYAEENWKENVPTGWYYSLDMWYRSNEKVLSTGAKILSVHVKSTFDKKVYG